MSCFAEFKPLPPRALNHQINWNLSSLWAVSLCFLVGLMATFSKTTYATRCASQVYCSQSPSLRQATADPCLCRRHSNTHRQVWLSLLWGLWVLVHTRFWRVWALILNAILPLLPSCRGFSFALGIGVSFFGGIQHSPVHGCSAASCSFGVLAEEDECMSFYSTILNR